MNNIITISIVGVVIAITALLLVGFLTNGIQIRTFPKTCDECLSLVNRLEYDNTRIINKYNSQVCNNFLTLKNSSCTGECSYFCENITNCTTPSLPAGMTEEDICNQVTESTVPPDILR
jgi:hypothetical protein